MDRGSFQRWLDRYVEAWRSGDLGQIGDLFSEDATYLWSPWDEPTRGRDRIVRAWTENPDPPGSWEAGYRVVAVDGDVGVAQGRTRYLESHEDMAGKSYDNISVCRFDAQGRCRDFTEWYMEPKSPGPLTAASAEQKDIAAAVAGESATGL
jgi:ketosteroid isomerase-like protein